MDLDANILHFFQKLINLCKDLCMDLHVTKSHNFPGVCVLELPGAKLDL
jgi:hypothetical protein